MRSKGILVSLRQLDEDTSIPLLDTSKRTPALEFFERNFAKIRFYLMNILKSEQFTSEEIKKSQKSFDSLIGWFTPEERPSTVLSMVYEKPPARVEEDRRRKLKHGTTVEKVDYFWHKIVKKIDNYPVKSYRRSNSDVFQFATSNAAPTGLGSTSNPVTRQHSPKRKQFSEPVDSTLFLLKGLTSGEKLTRKSTEVPSTSRFLLTSQKLELHPLVSQSKKTFCQNGIFDMLLPHTKNHTMVFQKKKTRVEELSPEHSNKALIRSASLLTAKNRKKFSTATTTRVTSIAPSPGKAYNIFDTKPGSSKLDFQMSSGGLQRLKAAVDEKNKNSELVKTESHDFKIKHYKSYRRQLTHSLAGSDAKPFKTTDEPTDLLRFEDSHHGLGKQARCSDSSTKLLGSSKFIESGKVINSLEGPAPRKN